MNNNHDKLFQTIQSQFSSYVRSLSKHVDDIVSDTE